MTAPDLDAARAMVEGVKPCAWLTDSVARWLEEYDGPACGRMTAVHRKPLKNGTGMAVYRATDYDALIAEVEALRDRVKTLERMDQEAANHVESVICMRTHFTGEPPYVGWEGLGLALREALDERDAGRATIAALEARVEALTGALAPFSAWAVFLPENAPDDRRVTAHGARVTYGDLRRARAALSQKDTPDA